MAFRYRYKPKGQEYKKFVLTIVVIILISLIYLLYQNYYLPTTTTTTVTTTTSTTTTIPITKGELVIAFKHNTEGKVKLSSISLGTIANELNI